MEFPQSRTPNNGSSRSNGTASSSFHDDGKDGTGRCTADTGHHGGAAPATPLGTAPMAAAAAAPPHPPHELTAPMLAVIVFYAVSGGPFGIEAAVRAGGVGYTLAALIAFPLVWSIPEAAMTAELASTFPEAAGGVAWVEEAFGHRMAFLSGYLGWVAGATDNAIYPVLFFDYVWQGWTGAVILNDNKDELDAFGNSSDSDSSSVGPNTILKFLLLSAMAIALAYVNWLGLTVVGNMSLIICFIAMSPFFILCVVGAASVDPRRWFLGPTEDISIIQEVTDDDIAGGFFPNLVVAGVMWRPFLNNLFWNLNSFDSAASLSGDVSDPGAIFPRGMFYAVIMVVAGYLVPMAVALGASNAPQHAWVDGYLATIASELVGPWLGGWTVFAAGISNIALFLAELSTESFQLMGMAERGFVPSVFAQRSVHGTPTYGILLGTIVVIALCSFDLATLIEMLNFNYSMALLLEYSAFIKLRITRPDVYRPWKIPFSTTGCICLFIPTFTMNIVILSLANYSTYIFSMTVVGIGFALYQAKMRGLWGNAEGPTNHTSSSLASPAATLSDVGSKGSYNRVRSGSADGFSNDNLEMTVTQNGRTLSLSNDDPIT